MENDNTIIIDSSGIKTYNLKIKNFNKEEKINEINLEYYIEFLINSREIFRYKVYKNEQEIKLNENKTDRFLLSNTERQEDEYKIEILLNDIFAKEINENIKIKIYFEQKNM